MAKERKTKLKDSKFKKLLIVIKRAYTGDVNKDNEYTEKTFTVLTSLLFYLISVGLLFLDFLLLIGTPIYYINTYIWSDVFGGIVEILFVCFIIVFFFILATLLFGAAREQEKEKGEKSIIVFSAMIGFVALIISLIALLK